MKNITSFIIAALLIFLSFPNRVLTDQDFKSIDSLLSKYSLRFRQPSIPLEVKRVWIAADKKHKLFVFFEMKSLSKQKIIYVEYCILGPECLVVRDQESYALSPWELRYGEEPFNEVGQDHQKPEPPIVPNGSVTLSISIADLENYQNEAKACSEGDTFSDLCLRILILDDHSGWKGYLPSAKGYKVKPFLPGDLKKAQSVY